MLHRRRWSVVASVVVLCAACEQKPPAGFKNPNQTLWIAIVAPPQDTFAAAAESVRSTAADLEAIAAKAGQKTDPRLNELASTRYTLLREWTQHATSFSAASADPKVPLSLWQKELAFQQRARDLAREFAPERVAEQEQVITAIQWRMDELTRGR